jgi:hypothetical protein
VGVHVPAFGNDFRRDRSCAAAQWLQQMRTVLGRLGALAAILQVGPLASATGYEKNTGSISMRVFGAGIVGAAAAIALLAGPVHAQMQTPNINLIPEFQSKTPEEKEQEAIKERAYKESLKKIPDAKGSSDPWGGVRSADAPKAAASPTKPKAKTGSTAN